MQIYNFTMLTTFGLSDPGNRKLNEDACYFDSKLGLSIVCDGIGGPKGGGDIASAIAIDVMKAQVQNNWSLVEAGNKEQESTEKRHAVARILEAAFGEASHAIFQRAQTDVNLAGMSTTMDVLLFVGKYAVLAHVGSGRMYLSREQSLHQITEDHTQLTEYKKKGKALPADLDAAALSKRITRAVGHQEHVKVDMLEVELMEGDQFILCTDGVWATLAHEKWKDFLQKKSPQENVQLLMAHLKTLAPKDNYSFLVTQQNQPQEVTITTEIDKKLTAKAKLELTGKIPLFQFLSYAEMIKVMSISELFKMKAGQVVCKEGEPGNEMMIILSGKLQVIIQGKTIAELGEGQAVGEMSMIEGGLRTATLTTMVDTNLLALSRNTLFDLLRAEPELCVKFLWGLTGELNRRLRTTTNQLAGRKEVQQTLQNNKVFPFFYGKES